MKRIQLYLNTIIKFKEKMNKGKRSTAQKFLSYFIFGIIVLVIFQILSAWLT